jgi:hypothetical protein
METPLDDKRAIHSKRETIFPKGKTIRANDAGHAVGSQAGSHDMNNKTENQP